MAENAAYYDSPLTGEELDEAFRELSALQESVTSAARSAEEAERWATQASQAANGYLGYYDTKDALVKAHPTGSAGDWATVGQTKSVWFWSGQDKAFVNCTPAATASLRGTVTVSDTPDSGKTAAGSWAASPAAVEGVRTTVNGTVTRVQALEKGVGTLGFLPPGDEATTQLFNSMGNTNHAAAWSWETGTDGINYLVARVDGTTVFVMRGWAAFRMS